MFIFCIHRRKNCRLCCNHLKMSFRMSMNFLGCNCCSKTNCDCSLMNFHGYTMSFCRMMTNCCFCLLKNFLWCSRKKNRLRMQVFCK